MKAGQAVEVWTGFGWEKAHLLEVGRLGFRVSFYLHDRREWVSGALLRETDPVGYNDTLDGFGR